MKKGTISSAFLAPLSNHLSNQLYQDLAKIYELEPYFKLKYQPCVSKGNKKSIEIQCIHSQGSIEPSKESKEREEHENRRVCESEGEK